jgi:hypothetical protein
MNMEVQSTERIQRPQLLNVSADGLRAVMLAPAWCSSLTITVVRVQGPRATSAFPDPPQHERHIGTFIKTFDTLPKYRLLLLFLLKLILV